jgi:hypothetical protein
MVEVLGKMKLKIPKVPAVSLFCIIALLFLITYPALAGQGCGTNWMGDTSTDKDFWVSKNQNQGISGSSASGTTAAGASIKTLGAAATKTSEPSLIKSLTPDKPSPQMAGTSITWTASINDQNNEKLSYNFLLKGPSTSGQFVEQTGWIAANTWTWNSSDKDVGDNHIEVQVKLNSSKDIDDNLTESYAIVAINPANTTSSDSSSLSPDSHPVSRTGESIKNKPRLAPDERPRLPATNPTGPNMSMPEPNQKSSTATENTVNQQADVQADVQGDETSLEEEQPQVADLGGKWTIRLEDIGSTLDLVLIQNGETIMGSGTLKEQNTKIPVTASGTVAGNSITLDVKTVVGEFVNKIDKSYDLELVKVERMISGTYDAYSGEDFVGKGNATASRIGL